MDSKNLASNLPLNIRMTVHLQISDEVYIVVDSRPQKFYIIQIRCDKHPLGGTAEARDMTYIAKCFNKNVAYEPTLYGHKFGIDWWTSLEQMKDTMFPPEVVAKQEQPSDGLIF